MAMKYEVWSIKDGKSDKMTYVVADNRDEAHRKAIEKFNNMGVSFEGVKVKL